MLVWLPRGTGVRELADLGLSPGLLSAGLGSVSPEQTYLDITQGNRVFNSLYEGELPEENKLPHSAGCGPDFWRAVNERADSAPAEIVPGLLTSTLESAGLGVSVGAGTSCTFSSPATGRQPQASPPKKLSGGPHRHPPNANALEVRSSTPKALPSLIRSLHGNDLLIAIERPPPAKDSTLAAAIAGRGFDGNLTSDSTRTDGYVLSTDVAPTILRRLGLEIPAQMSGQPIGTEGKSDPAALESRAARMVAIPNRRGSVIGLGLVIWLACLALAILASRGRAARAGVQLVGLSVVVMPLPLLCAAALEPSLEAEQLLVIAGSPLLALAVLVAFRGYRALAVASGLTVLAYAVDVIAGSPLTSLSLLGPNPGLGVRFYGIGNELEALLGVLVVAGTGAALTGYLPRLPSRRAAAAFLASGLLAAFVFAAGRFGADVGAAIVLPLGSATAAVAIGARRRSAALLIVALPVVVLALLASIDLVSGANAHLTRSVLDAGGLGDLAEVAQRRLQLSAHSFVRPIVFVFLPAIMVAGVWAIVRRDTIAAWLRGRPAMRAGLIGALAATAIGALANDSGALMLEVGGAYLLVFTGFVWSVREA